MDETTAKVIGCIYIALCSALSQEGGRLANDILHGFAADPANAGSAARFFRVLAEAGDREIEQPPEPSPDYRGVDDLLLTADTLTAH